MAKKEIEKMIEDYWDAVDEEEDASSSASALREDLENVGIEVDKTDRPK